MFIVMIIANNVNNYLMPDFVSNYFFTNLPEPNTPLVMFYNMGKITIFLGLKINLVYLMFLTAFGFIVYYLSLGLYKLFQFYIEPKISTN
jgi:hypothetical protein